MKTKKEMSKRAKHYFNAVNAGLFTMSTKDLRQLQKACERRTETNCWWAEYRMAPFLSQQIDQVIRDRQYMRKRARTGQER